MDCLWIGRAGKKSSKPAWNKGIPHTDSHKKNLKIAWVFRDRTYRPVSEETKKKISISNIGKNFGKNAWNKGRKCPKTSGNKNGNWNGGFDKIWYNNKRRLKKLSNGGGHTQREWEDIKEKFNNTCPCCFRKEPLIKLSIDHIIPIKLGGTDNVDNIQPLCRSCNSSKQTKIIRYEPESIILIQCSEKI